MSRADRDATWLFDQDPLTRSTQIFHYDAGAQKIIIEDRQNVDAILAAASAERQLDRAPRNTEMRKVASVPMNLFQAMRDEWRKKGLSWEERQQKMKDFLNDPSYRAFRTDPDCIHV